VRVTVTMPRETSPGPTANWRGRTRDAHAGGQWDWLAEPTFTADSETVEVTGLTTHLGWLFLWSDLTDIDAVASSLSAQEVGQPFRLLVALRPRLERPNPWPSPVRQVWWPIRQPCSRHTSPRVDQPRPTQRSSSTRRATGPATTRSLSPCRSTTLALTLRS
jgi:hypothetical protein